jgi:hypothetical protein
LWQEKFQEDEDHRRRLLAASSEDKLVVWPSVALYSPYDVAPVGLVHAGGTYSIVIEGFDPTMDEVVIELVEGLRERGEVIATTATLTTLTWTAPPRSAGDGSPSPSRFFLYAHNKRLPGLFEFFKPLSMGEGVSFRHIHTKKLSMDECVSFRHIHTKRESKGRKEQRWREKKAW